MAVFDDQPPYGHWQMETSRPGATGIEIKDTVAGLLLGLVGVTRNHNAESGGQGLEVKPSQIVQHVDGNSTSLDHLGRGQFASPRTSVYIAKDGGQRRKGCQR